MSDDYIVEKYEKRFDDYDTEKHDKIDKDAFNILYNEIQNKTTIHRDFTDIIFNGIDFNGTGYINKQDFISFVKSELYGDELQQYKIIFRAFDKSRTGALTTDDVIDIGRFVNKKITKREAELTLLSETGMKNGSMTFPVFYKMMTGRDTDPKTDPYDGRLKNHSLCCLLL